MFFYTGEKMSVENAKSEYLLDRAEIVLPPVAERRGATIFYVMKDDGGNWYIGRPKGDAIWWDKTVLGDLLNHGLTSKDLEGVCINTTYCVMATAVFLKAC